MSPEIITGLFGVGSNLISNIFNWYQNEQANELSRENLQWQKDAFNEQIGFQRNQFERQQALAEHQQQFQEQSQEQQWAREDTSYQRTKNDLEAAGYSPLAINGTNDAGSIASNASQPSIPSQGVPELQGINPFQASNLGIGQLADILGQVADRELKSRELDIEEQHYLTTEKQKKVELNIRRNEVENEIAQNQQKINQDYEIATKNLELQWQKTHNDSIKEAHNFILKIKEMNDLMKYRNDKEARDKAYSIMQQVTDGKGHFKTDFDNYFNYLKYKNWFEAKQKEYMDKIAQASKEFSSYSESKEYNELEQPRLFSNGREKSKSYKNDPVTAAYHEWYGFLAQNGYPIWIEETNKRKDYY